jgi:hypothetical protein
MAATPLEVARARLAVESGLRRWAQGALTDIAAVELRASTFGGRHVRPGVAWVRPCARPGWYWLDADALAAHAATLHDGQERRVLTLAAQLVDGDPWTRRPAIRRSVA